MINVNIISKVEIPTIKEHVIEQLIKNEILKENPSLTIKSITFERKLNPQRIEAVVDAEITGSTPIKLVEEAVAEAEDEATTEVVEDSTTEEPVEVPSVEEPNDKPMAAKPPRKRVFS